MATSATAYDSNVFIEAGNLTPSPPVRARCAHERVRNPRRRLGRRQLDGAGLGRRQRDRWIHRDLHRHREPGRRARGDGGRNDALSARRASRTVPSTPCVVDAHNANGTPTPSAASPRSRRPVGDAHFSMTVNTSAGGILLINPEGPDNLGTTGKIKIPPQGGPAKGGRDASLFVYPRRDRRHMWWQRVHRPGHRVVGEQPVRDQEDADQVHRGQDAHARREHPNAVAYKDGVPVANCPAGSPTDQAEAVRRVAVQTSPAVVGRSLCWWTAATRKGGLSRSRLWPCDGLTFGYLAEAA